MADAFSKIMGDKQIIANLNAIGANVKKMVVRSSMRKGAAVVAKRAKTKVKKRSGLLVKAIKAKATRDGNGKAYVDPKVVGEYKGKKVRPANYAHLVEFGTKTAPAHPFLREALEEAKAEAMEAIRKEAVKKFDALAKKGRTNVR